MSEAYWKKLYIELRAENADLKAELDELKAKALGKTICDRSDLISAVAASPDRFVSVEVDAASKLDADTVKAMETEIERVKNDRRTPKAQPAN